MRKELVDAIALVKSSEHRSKIMKEIGDKIKTPSEIAKNTDIRVNHVSVSLKVLKEKKLLKCLNEEKKKGRLYQLTEFGKDVLKRIG